MQKTSHEMESIYIQDQEGSKSTKAANHAHSFFLCFNYADFFLEKTRYLRNNLI